MLHCHSMGQAKLMKYYEDIEVGITQKFGNYHVTREEVIEYASKYDPQPFHLDDDAAAATHFGRLSASGWHTASMTMRMMVDNLKAHKQASLGSPGLQNLQWKTPVYPGDTLRCESETLTKRRSEKRPEMGIMTANVRVYNQDDVMVMSMETTGLIAVRDV